MRDPSASSEVADVLNTDTHTDDTKSPTLVPGREKETFRNYEDSDRQAIVHEHYRLMRTNQTMDFAKRMKDKWSHFDKAEMGIREAFEILDGYVDSSDPDSALPNVIHDFQTAEAIRAAGKPDWYQLVGLLHDMGKIMFNWGAKEDGQIGTAQGPQWALGGDTWVLGCRIPDDVVMPQFNSLNPDMQHPVYSTTLGIYEPGCGIENLTFAYGHDEYMYQMLKHNKCSIPAEGMAMIRYHSCYPLHSRGAYKELLAEEDRETLDWVIDFNQFDLYTKADKEPILDELWPYYQQLIDKYCPGKLQW